MTMVLSVVRWCESCYNIQSSGRTCTKCDCESWTFSERLVDKNTEKKKIPDFIINSRQITLFDD